MSQRINLQQIYDAQYVQVILICSAAHEQDNAFSNKWMMHNTFKLLSFDQLHMSKKT